MADLASPAQARAILSQPFHYLGRGAKVHAAVSADGLYVLKTLNTADDFVRWWADDDADLARLLELAGRGDPLEAATVLLKRARDSYRLAAAELVDETGLLFLHLDRTESFEHLPIAIDDAVLDADTDAYIVQHRAELVRDRIKGCEQAGDRAGSLRVLDDVIALIARIWRKRITEDSFNFHNNYGYVGHRLIQVDIGEFEQSAARVREEMEALKVLRQKSQAYLRRKYPELADEFTARVRARLTPAALGIPPLPQGR